MKQLGKYELLEELGRGGYGVVYKALDIELKVARAVKILHPNLVHAVEFIQRFQREARITAALDHPNIVTVYNLSEEQGYYYLAMKYMPGGSLKDLLARQGRIPFERALAITLQVAAGLQHAHTRPEKVVHRDIKPANILFDEEGKARVSDFGFAKALSMDDSPMVSSITGNVVGTPAYMAPEVWWGKPATPTTDVYSLGCVFFEMITGQALFSGESPAEMMTRHINQAPQFPTEWPAGVPAGVEAALRKALAKDPAKRYLSMDDFTKALEKLKDKGDKGKKEEPPHPSKLWMLVVILMLGFIGTLLWDPKGCSPTPPVAKATETSPPLAYPSSQATLTPDVTATPTLGIGSALLREQDEMTMLYIPAGEFQMGYESEDGDERPVHKVFLDAFWMDQTEVTNAMYRQCLNNHGCDPIPTKFLDDPNYDDHPVVLISWLHADTYCKWAESRLPTEAEWEKAARGTDNRLYPWGNEFVCAWTNGDDEIEVDDYSVPGGPGCDGHKLTAPVGSFKRGKSPFGLYDMAGNVREWVFDWYDPSYYKVSPLENPTGPLNGKIHVLRGGDWYSDTKHLRSVDRFIYDITTDSYMIGFRCARDALP